MGKEIDGLVCYWQIFGLVCLALISYSYRIQQILFFVEIDSMKVKTESRTTLIDILTQEGLV